MWIYVDVIQDEKAARSNLKPSSEGSIKRKKVTEEIDPRPKPPRASTDIQIRNLLGRLYGDRQFLDDVLREASECVLSTHLFSLYLVWLPLTTMFVPPGRLILPCLYLLADSFYHDCTMQTYSKSKHQKLWGASWSVQNFSVYQFTSIYQWQVSLHLSLYQWQVSLHLSFIGKRFASSTLTGQSLFWTIRMATFNSSQFNNWAWNE